MRIKKGFIYTLFAMSFLLALSIYVFVQGTGYKGELVAQKIRSDEMGFFVKGAQEDYARSVVISARRAALAVANYEIDNGSFTQDAFGLDANQSIADALQNGSVKDVVFDIMSNSTLSDWTSRIQELGERKGVNVNISAAGIRIAPLSAFEIVVTGNMTTIAYDPLAKIKYNRTALMHEAVSAEGFEDPYITIKSLGSIRNTIRRCESAGGEYSGSQWLYGTAYVTEALDCGGASHESKILITNNMSGKLPSCYDFKANVTEDDSASGQYYLLNVTGATSKVKPDSYVILSDDRLWITNSTSCYFEAPDGPSFLDRLEGRSTTAAKYDVPGVTEGTGSLLYIPSCSNKYVLDYVYFTSGC